jgi:hypothetical protein
MGFGPTGGRVTGVDEQPTKSEINMIPGIIDISFTIHAFHFLEEMLWGVDSAALL